MTSHEGHCYNIKYGRGRHLFKDGQDQSPNPFKMDFPSDPLIEKAISIRHDIVHRNGKDKDGNPTVISEDNVKELAEHIDDFMQNINNQIFEQNFEK